MKWNSKTDVIVLMISCCGFALIGLVAGILMPIIFRAKTGDILALWPIAALAVLAGILIYVLKRQNSKK